MMASLPVTSVVVPTWNSGTTLPRALASVMDTSASIEIIVVDDRSDDIALLRMLAASDPRITLIEKAERSNAAHSRAIGLARARGDLVAFLDADDHFRPGHLARRRHLHERQRAGVVVGRFCLNDGTSEWVGPMADYDGGDYETYLFSGGGDARSSTISVHKKYLVGTTFDARLAKHQDWSFLLAADRNGEHIGFDSDAGVVIDISGASRMSARSNVEASLAFARDHVRSEANRRNFLRGRLRTSLRLGDIAAATRFRSALLTLRPSLGERLSSRAMLTAGQLGLAAPLHRLLAAVR
jgi:glycosyltransferase involved in cell wall biosynthesis